MCVSSVASHRVTKATGYIAKTKDETIRRIAENRSARHDYFIVDELEAGIVLRGTEVKSLRAGKVQLSGGYAKIFEDELWLDNIHISAYKEGNLYNHDPIRRRKLLLHRKELDKLGVKLHTKGVTVVPVSIYFKGNKVKVKLGIAKGKKAYDKRETIKARDVKRELDRE